MSFRDRLLYCVVIVLWSCAIGGFFTALTLDSFRMFQYSVCAFAVGALLVIMRVSAEIRRSDKVYLAKGARRG